MMESIRLRAERAIEARVFPGCVIGVITPGAGQEVVAHGSYTYEKNARLVRERTMYDVASMTKSIPTASLALVLAFLGKLSLENEVAEYLPEFQNHYGATVSDLLRYSVRGARLSELRDLSAEEMLAYLFERGFDGPPGVGSYTNLPALLLGLVIERAMGTTLDVLSSRYFFDPLRMNDTVFYAGAPLAHAVPTEMDEWRHSVVGETHDESAYLLAKSGRIPGHAGLFSTAPDLMRFAGMLLEGRDERALAIATGAEAGLGWQVDQPYFMGAHATHKTFGKTGFTGTSVLIDRQRHVALVILSNRTYPKRPPDAISENCAINVFRRDIADIVFSNHN
jgi:CubicO group peptidase (beta-lactamase class C family)